MKAVPGLPSTISPWVVGPLRLRKCRHPGATPASFVPAQLETDLRQAKWQKLRYPNSTSLVVPVGFHPYTMIQTYGPGVNTSGTAWQRVWEANRWMPFSWAFPIGTSTATARGIAFYGPYMVVDGPNGDVSELLVRLRWNVPCV